MAASFLVLLLGLGVGGGLLLIAGGILLLVVGSRRHDDSSSRPFLAFGVTLLVLGTVVLVPAVLWGAQMLVGMR